MLFGYFSPNDQRVSDSVVDDVDECAEPGLIIISPLLYFFSLPLHKNQ